MTNANIIKSAVLSTLRTIKVGACLGLGGMAVLSSLENAQAQATQIGSNTGTLTLTLTVSSSVNPDSCGFGTQATTSAGSISASNSITAGSSTTYVSDNSTSGTLSAISVYCTAAFYVSAGGSQSAGFTAMTNYPASQRYLYTSGTAAYPYYLVLGATSSPTTVPTTSLWGGDGTTGCNDAFDGDITGTGGLTGTFTKGCYKSGTPSGFSTVNQAKIPWAYYIGRGTGTYASWVSGTYSDTIQLSLNY